MIRIDPTNLVFPFPLQQMSGEEALASSPGSGRVLRPSSEGAFISPGLLSFQHVAFLHVGYHLPAKPD